MILLQICRLTSKGPADISKKKSFWNNLHQVRYWNNLHQVRYWNNLHQVHYWNNLHQVRSILKYWKAR